MSNEENAHPDHKIQEKLDALGQHFRPGAPVDTFSLLKGRGQQVSSVLAAVRGLGQHAVVFGEPGVGKTSLAHVARSIVANIPPRHFGVRIQCSADDSFASVWRKFYAQALVESDIYPGGNQRDLSEAISRVESICTADEVSPFDAYRVLNIVGRVTPVFLVIDEFDRIPDYVARELFSDLIKNLSDNLAPVTVVIVGVSDDVGGLISGHQSIQRALTQIPMPRMGSDELTEVLNEGLASAGITVPGRIARRCVELSQGLPYYVHLIGGLMGEFAVLDGKDEVQNVHYIQALQAAVERTSHTIVQKYRDATASHRSDALYEIVLLACALAETDDLGYFLPSAVREPYSVLTKKNRRTADFIRHLQAFCDYSRGPIFDTRGEGRQTKYRFIDPLLQPYVLILGFVEGRLSGEDVDKVNSI
ncbi:MULTISPECIES: AAA family ATPase [unclassified Nocardiopsis]|uniref:AAA family ATPase n=1 Tax=unclassified Nocardiopsis TaxID=2649073 RepID=UPI0009FA0080|nr:AAA family ATPase [Nocardiopsis sp. TSRI0078]